MLTIVNFIYPSVQIMLQVKRPPWLGLKGKGIRDWMLNDKLKLNDAQKCVLDWYVMKVNIVTLLLY